MLVIFDNPRGTFVASSNVTYLSTLTIGLVSLYKELRSRFIRTDILIHFHIARLKNTDVSKKTRTVDEASLLLQQAQLNNNAGTILRDQYTLSIEHAAYLAYGDSILSDCDLFTGIKDFEIMDSAHHMTIPCDYIYNHYNQKRSPGVGESHKIRSRYDSIFRTPGITRK